jgi:hypothetical protein
LYWPRVLGGSNIMKLVRALDAYAKYARPHDPCNTLDASRPYGELRAGLSKNLQASLRKSRKRLAESGGAHITVNGVPMEAADENKSSALTEVHTDEINRAYDAFLAVEASGWKGSGGTGSAITLDDSVTAFYAELIAQRGKDFRPEVTLLLRGSKPIAAQFSVVVDSCKHVLKIGYDEHESRFSPGQVLMAGVLETASVQGLKRVNLVTNMPWHQTWRPLPEPTFSVTVVFRRGWRTALHRGYLAASRLAKSVLLRRAAPGAER